MRVKKLKSFISVPLSKVIQPRPAPGARAHSIRNKVLRERGLLEFAAGTTSVDLTDYLDVIINTFFKNLHIFF